jgi:hypothetical protein
LPSTNTSTIPYFNGESQSPQLNALGGYVSGDHINDADSSQIQTPSGAGYLGFVQITIA